MTPFSVSSGRSGDRGLFWIGTGANAIRVSIQRTRLREAWEARDAPPRSHGFAPLLPIGDEPPHATASSCGAVCVYRDEAVWLGFRAAGNERVTVCVSAVGVVEPVAVGPSSRAFAWRIGDKPLSPAANGRERLDVRIAAPSREPDAAAFTLWLLPPEAYQTATGGEPPAPISVKDAYGGWRLP